jgi:hypothetical protein
MCDVQGLTQKRGAAGLQPPPPWKTSKIKIKKNTDFVDIMI